ncbi:MAG: HAD-IA family hydrolase [Myxococcota bacterium]
MAAAMGVEPEACLFFDDRPESCAAARALGMQAYRVDRALGEDDRNNLTLCDLSIVPDLVSPS